MATPEVRVFALEQRIHSLASDSLVLEVMEIRETAAELPAPLRAQVLDSLCSRLVELVPHAFR